MRGSRTASEELELLEDVSVDPAEAVRRASLEADLLNDGKDLKLQDRLMGAIVKLLREEGGRDIVAVDVSRKTNWMNGIIIVTGMVSRHNVALANKLRAELRSAGLIKSVKIERNEDDDWIIVNCGTLVVQILSEEQRAALDLERLWVLKQDEAEALGGDEKSAEFTYDDEDGTRDLLSCFEKLSDRQPDLFWCSRQGCGGRGSRVEKEGKLGHEPAV